MAWVYMIINICDFILFPVFWSLFQIHGKGEVSQQWVPMTLSSGGLFIWHLALCWVLPLGAVAKKKLRG